MDNNEIDPLDGSFDDVVDSMVHPAPDKQLKNNNNTGSGGDLTAPVQLPLDLGIEVEKTVGGLEMGILQNGMPYLTQKGLAAMSGAARATVFEISQEWEAFDRNVIPSKGRVAFFTKYLLDNGYDEPRLFIEILRNGSPHYAYPDIVCMAFLEYMAFEARTKNEVALDNYRKFARFGLQQFIYQALNYSPEDPWALHNARVSLLNDSVPAGYFSVFKESSGLIVDLINGGLIVNQHTIPDNSIGSTWAPHWTKHGYNGQFGERVPYDHYFPPQYPQSASNPQQAWAYPDAALPLFRLWLREVYLTTKYPRYILKKANVLSGGIQEAERLANLYNPDQITN